MSISLFALGYMTVRHSEQPTFPINWEVPSNIPDTMDCGQWTTKGESHPTETISTSKKKKDYFRVV